jgi:hypothetical protein
MSTAGPATVGVQIRFERFPASIKGAFVMRGADGDPHAIHLQRPRIEQIPDGPSKPIPLEDRMLDVTPVRDLFVPFEVGVTELPPAWYALMVEAKVDAGKTWTFSSRAFTIPWPRSDLRRGSARVGRSVRLGDRSFGVDRVELGSDAAAVFWRPEPQTRGEAGGSSAPEAEAMPAVVGVLIADGEPLGRLPPEAGARLLEPKSVGEYRTLSYPVSRYVRSLEVVLRSDTGEESETLVVSLP